MSRLAYLVEAYASHPDSTRKANEAGFNIVERILKVVPKISQQAVAETLPIVAKFAPTLGSAERIFKTLIEMPHAKTPELERALPL